MRNRAVTLLCLAIAAHACSAAEAVRHVRFTTHEGSWLSFDVSSDGRWIVMDLLGDLWRLPIEGGVAVRITNVVHDSAEFLDPAFAVDGATIIAHGEFRGRPGVFRIPLSGDSVQWIAPDSSQLSVPRGRLQLLHGVGSAPTRLLRSVPDEDGASTLYERDVVTGDQRRIDIVGVAESGHDAPAYSADGTEVFFATRRDWDDDGTMPIGGRVWRVPASGGEARAVSPARLRAQSPAPSPDGRRIAYFVIDSLNSAQVWVQDLTDSSGIQITNDKDVTPTRVRWLAGSDELVYVESGRLWRFDLRTRHRREIPFSATVDFSRRTPALPPLRIFSSGDRVVEKGMRGYSLSPDGRALAIISRDTLWVAPAVTGAIAHAVAAVPADARHPHWSPDGRVAWMAGPTAAEDLFVTDTITRMSSRLFSTPVTEMMPAWSRDGRYITFVRLNQSEQRSPRQHAIRAGDSAGVPSATIDLGMAGRNELDGRAQWSPRGDAVLVVAPQGIGGRPERLAELRFLNGSPVRRVRGLPQDISLVNWLPRDTVVFIRATRLMRAPFDVEAGIVGPAVPVSDEPVAFLDASTSGDLLYVSEDGLRLRSPGRSPRHIGWPVRYTVPTPPPLVIRNVRIIDGSGSPPTTPKDILIERGRITRIAAVGEIATRSGVTVLDAEGRIATPGLIDLHGHHGGPAQMRGALYYGVTTIRNFSSAIRDDHLPGKGPRIVRVNVQIETDWSGTSVGRAGIATDSTSGHLGRAIRMVPGLGAAVVKNYANSGWAAQVRTVSAAHALGVRVTGHCAYPLTLIAAGIDSKEHLGFQCSVHDTGPWYDDLIQLYAHSGVAIVPTAGLFVSARLDGAQRPLPSPVDRLFSDVERERLASPQISSAAPANLAQAANVLDAARKLHRAGVLLGTGTDMERPDGMQYELEALVEASLSPLEAIASATSVSARIIGASADLGRIAPRLLADLVILDADPTKDIRNMRRIWSVIQGGHVVDRFP